MASTSRRALLAALVPAAAPTEYASAAEVFAAIDSLEAAVESRLRAIASALPASRPFAESLLRDHARQRSGRASLRQRLKLPAASESAAATADDTSLEALRAATEALVYAHAEGLPALGNAHAVDRLARDMVELSRHLTLVQLWIEQEEARG